jgi:hypothetical protein
MADVFLSYKREDRARVGLIAKTLETEGFSVWWDPEIPLGESYSASIRRELDLATSVVPVWSQQSVDSEWVQEEATLAKRRGAIVPCRIDAVEPPIGFTMVQTADLVGWTGDRAHPEWRKLVGHIAENAKRPAKNAPKAHTAATEKKKGFNAGLFAAGVGILVALSAGGWFLTRDVSGKATIGSARDAGGGSEYTATVEVQRGAGASGAGIDAGEAQSPPGAAAAEQPAAKFAGHTGPIAALATSPNGKFLASVAADKTLRLWDIADGRLISTFEDGAGASVAFAPKGGLIATGGKDGVTRIRSLATGSVIKELSQVGAVTAVGFSADGAQIVTGGSDGKWRSWTVASGAMLAEQDAKRGPLAFVGFDPAGSVMAAGPGTGYVQIANAATGVEMKNINASSGPMRATAIAPGNTRFAVVGDTPQIYLFDALNHGYQPFDKNVEGSPLALAFSADGARVAATSSGPMVQVYDVNSRKEIARINTGATSSYVAMSAAGDAVIVSDGPNGARRFEVGK